MNHKRSKNILNVQCSTSKLCVYMFKSRTVPMTAILKRIFFFKFQENEEKNRKFNMISHSSHAVSHR